MEGDEEEGGGEGYSKRKLVGQKLDAEEAHETLKRLRSLKDKERDLFKKERESWERLSG